MHELFQEGQVEEAKVIKDQLGMGMRRGMRNGRGGGERNGMRRGLNK